MTKASSAGTYVAQVQPNSAGTISVVEAEIAVAASPRDAAARARLAQAYLAAGRLDSAQTAFGDALTLDPLNGRASLGLALVQIALGKRRAALETLDSAHDLPDADRGLALALAGETLAAIRVLEPAARSKGAHPKTRQNLALAYALAGQWSASRAIAAQDLTPDQLADRMLQWASFAQPRNSWDQLASIMGFVAVEDPGQPIQLALAPEPRAGTALASLQSNGDQDTEAQAQNFLPIVSDAIAAEAVATAVNSDYAPIRQISFAAHREVVQPIPAQEAPLVRAITAPAHLLVKPAGATVEASSGYVIQIGAYTSADRAQAAWSNAVSRFGDLGNYTPTSSKMMANGAELHRLSLGGFGSRGEAASMCEKIRGYGVDCFVRSATGEVRMQWAHHDNIRLASR